MMNLTCGLIDVFADTSLSGNPLAVVEGADALPDETLQRIAGEFNQAETTFLMKRTRGDWKLRSFTASGAEIFGAGHNRISVRDLQVSGAGRTFAAISEQRSTEPLLCLILRPSAMRYLLAPRPRSSDG